MGFGNVLGGAGKHCDRYTTGKSGLPVLIHPRQWETLDSPNTMAPNTVEPPGLLIRDDNLFFPGILGSWELLLPTIHLIINTAEKDLYHYSVMLPSFNFKKWVLGQSVLVFGRPGWNPGAPLTDAGVRCRHRKHPLSARVNLGPRVR